MVSNSNLGLFSTMSSTTLLSSLISHLHLELFSWQITFCYDIKLKVGFSSHLELDLPLIISDHPSAPPCAPTSLNSDSSFGHKSTFRRLHSSHHSFSQQSGQSGTHCTIIEQRRNLNNLVLIMSSQTTSKPRVVHVFQVRHIFFRGTCQNFAGTASLPFGKYVLNVCFSRN